MSYILEALNKAERERDIKRVPTLSTIHSARVRSGNRSWIIPVAVIIVMALGLGILLYIWTHKENPGAESADKAALEQNSNLPASGSPIMEPQEENASEEQIPTRNKASDSRVIRDFREERVSPEVPISTRTTADSAVVSAGKIDRSPLPEQMIPQTNLSIPESTIPERDMREASTPPFPDDGLTAAEPSRTDISDRKSELHKAMETMNISILNYSTNPSERMVFINGRKYIEGDYIDGLYLVKEINLNGVVLSYEGTQAVLEPNGF